MKTKTHRLTLNKDRYEAHVGRRAVPLTAKEFDLLHTLKTCNTVLTREDLLRAVWGVDAVSSIQTRTVDQHVARIRRKCRVPAIATVPTRGYKYVGA